MAKNNVSVIIDRKYREGLIDGARQTDQKIMDYVQIALGRMGFGEVRQKRFFDVMTEVWNDYEPMLIDDYKNVKDKETVYYKAKVDEELKRYCGSFFEPYDKRSKAVYYDLFLLPHRKEKQNAEN